MEDCVDLAIPGLEEYVRQSEERLIVARRGSNMLGRESGEEFKKRKLEEIKREWREKLLHEQHIRQLESIESEESWLWLKDEKMKKETEGLLVAAQDQALRTNVIKKRIHKTQENSKCKM